MQPFAFFTHFCHQISDRCVNNFTFSPFFIASPTNFLYNGWKPPGYDKTRSHHILKVVEQNDCCTLTLFCRLPSLNLEKMGKIGEKVPIPSGNVVPRNIKKYLTKRLEYLFICETRREGDKVRQITLANLGRLDNIRYTKDN